MVLSSIFLRHKGSPESKPAGAANAEPGAGASPHRKSLIVRDQPIVKTVPDIVIEESALAKAFRNAV
ncbi:hypothetical protein [Mesorhizobium sp. B2-5-13]|uniref:hypothetical protein n=1 Tax=unclassified Mesorhizobium TaxID=325217 RepID=UPI0032B28E35